MSAMGGILRVVGDTTDGDHLHLSNEKCYLTEKNLKHIGSELAHSGQARVYIKVVFGNFLPIGKDE
jgi:hypothetical protein